MTEVTNSKCSDFAPIFHCKLCNFVDGGAKYLFPRRKVYTSCANGLIMSCIWQKKKQKKNRTSKLISSPIVWLVKSVNTILLS